MNRFKKFINITTILFAIIGIAIVALAYYKAKSNLVAKEQVILDYYQNVETLLDSLYIYENSTIFNTDVGNRYLESKHKFDSLIIMTSNKEEE